MDWPAPHHMSVIDLGAPSEPEPGLLTLDNGEKLRGTVHHIDFDRGVLEFKPEVGPARVLAFREFRSLYLARTIELERLPVAARPGGLEARVSRDRRGCEVLFKDGSTMELVVVAVVRRKAGLFLFMPHYADAILRWFMPAESIATYRLGELEGKRPSAGAEPSSVPPAPEPPQAAQDGAPSGAVPITRDVVQQALRHQKTLTRRKLGEVLVRDGLITQQQCDAALKAQVIDRRKLLGEILVDMGAVSSEAIRKVLVEQLGVPSMNLDRFAYDQHAIQAVPGDLARKHLAMPLYRSDKRIAVAMENPMSWVALHELEFVTGLKVDPVMASRENLLAAIAQFYDGPAEGEKIGQLVDQLGREGDDDETAPAEVTAESDNTLVRLVNKMIVDAYQQGASDIHVEARADKASRVRFRIDGVLAPYIEVPARYRAALVSRIKIMCALDISERRRPQDGKIHFEDYGARRIELRVVTIPTSNGLEDVVLRILAAPKALTLDQLALAPHDLAELKTMASRAFGLLFVCGPTGSGKTTMLHSLLSHINEPQRKIWTVEDLIEITQEGLCQVQVNAKLGLTFPEVLRSFLRADPDVIMVGETRDPETARAVIAASLTGHLVFSTMHTNSAVESVVRLLDFGLDAFNFSDALLGVVGQRLVRRLCPACRTSHVASTAELELLAREYCRDGTLAPEAAVARWRSRYGTSDGAISLGSSVGCPACDHSGYKGRVGVYELLVATPAIKSAIQSRASSAEILQRAIDNGMVTLEQDAIEKILQGELDLKQVQASCR